MTTPVAFFLSTLAAQVSPDAPPAPAPPVPEEPAETEPAPPPPTPAPTIAPAPAPASFEGTVRDKIGGAPSEGVMVLVDADVVATTDAGGRFAVAAVAPGPHLITLVGPQGEELHQEVTFGAGAHLERSFAMPARDVETIRIVTKAPRPKREAGELELSQKEVATVPGTFGDPVRVIEN